MRYLVDPITRDLKKKMVFLGGPRQCGKTTLAKSILASSKGRYLNWDSDEGRASILSKRWDQGDHLLVMDELHKYPRWKNWIKGVYDTQKQDHQILSPFPSFLKAFLPRKGSRD
jgi:predicted AAA+ superfamily ATPase